MSLAISIPEKKVSAWMAETTIPGTQTWLSRLPIADSLESARDLYQALYTLNRMEVSPKPRMELMEMYRLPVSQVTGQLHNRISNASYPLSQKHIRLAEFIRDLHMEMAYGYKLTLFDLEAAKRPVWGKSSTRPKAIFRSIHYLGNVVLRSMHNYMDCPEDVWKEIHSLYEFAESAKCLDEPVAEFDEEQDRTSTISKRYKEILLLGLSEPNRMSQDQCKQVNGFTYRWAELTEIRIYSDEDGLKDGQFVIQLEKDEPGLSVQRAKTKSVRNKKSVRVLELTPLIDNISSMIRRIETGTPARELDLGGECLEEACIDMLEKLLKAWSGNQQRQSSRIPMKGIVSVCSGLTSVHYFVNELQNNFMQEKKSDISEKVASRSEAKLLSGKTSQPNDSGLTSSIGFKVAKWEIVDASAAGARIIGKESDGVTVRVGDLFALMDSTSQSPLKLFSVRWLRELGKQGMEIGLELMSSKVSSILVSEERGAGGYVPGLLLDKVASSTSKLPRTLILKKDLRGRQKDIEMIELTDTRSKWVRVLESIDKTNSYERVSFASLSKDTK